MPYPVMPTGPTVNFTPNNYKIGDVVNGATYMGYNAQGVQPPSNNFPSPYSMGYPTGTPINGSVQNNFPSPYSMGYAPGTPINGQVLNNFPSPYSMGWAPGTPTNGQILNNFSSPYSMGYSPNAQGGVSPTSPYTAQGPGASGNVLFNPNNQPLGTTPLPGGSQGPASAGGNMPIAQSLVNGVVGPTPNPGDGQIGGLPTAPPDLASITQLVNGLNQQGQQASNYGRIPGEAGLEQQSSNNIGNLLSGIVPQDVRNQMGTLAAERGIATGSPGSQNANASLLQGLGLTSLGLQQQGQQDLSAAVARNPGARVFDPSQLLLTPAQKLQAQAEANRLALAWYQALHPNQGGGRGGGGGQPSGMPSGNSDWFSNALRNLTGGVGASPSAPLGGGFGGGDYTNPEWGDLYSGYNDFQTGDPFTGYGSDGGYTPPDSSDPGYWDFTGGSNDFTSGDPFTGYE